MDLMSVCRAFDLSVCRAGFLFCVMSLPGQPLRPPSAVGPRVWLRAFFAVGRVVVIIARCEEWCAARLVAAGGHLAPRTCLRARGRESVCSRRVRQLSRTSSGCCGFRTRGLLVFFSFRRPPQMPAI